MHFATNTAILALTVASVASALGINCQGSSQCSQGTGEVSRKLTGYINQIDSNRWINNGDLIACVREPHGGDSNGAICAFMQGTGGETAGVLKGLAQDLVNHGCNKCGSVPLFFDQGDNNPNDHGILTFNYVGNGCGKSGVC
ncbi:killer toxin [Tothia fuscella]|uniref:Killer toxin n=1 Tax=Tothia fuscella TaxID=1048955 RepID=A0A9P4TTR5_9PEZI|nr:killer toxin [Tothia fuscella]